MAAVAQDRPTLVESTPAADPAPLGLAGFALTTFLLSGHNATFIPDLIWVGPALFYGGLAQLLAGMWEFRNRNVFGATAFSTYGGFWLSLGIFVILLSSDKGFGAGFTGADVPNAIAWFLFAFSMFNTYMLLGSMRVNMAVFGVFLTLEVTEILLVIGNFMGAHGHANSGWVHWGGWLGIVTAAVAWYTSAAGVVNGMAGKKVLPVGQPMWKPGTAGASDDAEEMRPARGERRRHESAIETILLEERRYPPPAGVRQRRRTRSRRSTTRASRLLGAGGPRARHLVRALHRALRVGAAVREVVSRRQAQRLPSTASTATSRRATATRSPTTGRARPSGERRGDHLRRPPARRRPLRERAEGARREEGDSGRDLHGHGPGAAGGDARVHAARRAAHGRLRRLLGRLALRPA